MLNKEKGFTLIEIIIVIAIISIITVISIVSWRSFSDVTNLGNTAKMIEIKIKLAKSYSLSALNDTNYGVHLKSDSVTIFSGSTYIDGDSANQVFALTDGVEIYGGAVGSDIIFSRLTGTTDDAGNIDIRVINDNSKTKIITINSQGQTGTDIFGASGVPAIVEDTTNNINARHIHFDLGGWSIQDYDTLRLEWTGAGVTVPFTKDIIMASYFNGDKSSFDWQGMETVDSASQSLRVHTISLDSLTTLLCIIRDRMKNNESLNIYFLQSGTPRKIVNYTENGGTVTVTPNLVYVNEMLPQ
ncbi:MAG: prepilin-type N-terminal cleavage/methylation domain-containing protein [Candidatus Falkowbacteria bacterium]